MEASPHHGRSDLLGSPVPDLSAWSGAFRNCLEWIKNRDPPRAGHNAGLAAVADPSTPPNVSPGAASATAESHRPSGRWKKGVF